MSIFDQPCLGGLFGDAEIAEHLSEASHLAAMVQVELAFTRALGQAGRITSQTALQAVEAMSAIEIDQKRLRDGARRDGLIVPALVEQLRAGVAPELRAAVHSGLTSQDVIDTALILNLRPVLSVFEQRLNTLFEDLEALSARHGAAPLMGRTRMQAALPITVADRIALWSMPLGQHRAALLAMRPRFEQLQFGGAVGTRHAFGEDGTVVAEEMAKTLGLPVAPKAQHAMREGWADMAGWLSLVSGSLGKMGQDMALMAQQGIDEIALSGGGTSSAMAHKSNPVLAELLVTLARFNAVQLGGMHQSLIHEQERSGMAWALEWMILPQMVMATGRALSAASELIKMIERIGAPERE